MKRFFAGAFGTSASLLKSNGYRPSQLWKLDTESSILRSGLSLTDLESSSKAAIERWGQ
jgi:hypothetical protein